MTAQSVVAAKHGNGAAAAARPSGVILAALGKEFRPPADLSLAFPYLQGVWIEWVLWTPEAAKRALEECNLNNRNIVEKNFEMLCRAAEGGNFCLSPDMIAFDRLDMLRNGQHRLATIVKTGIPQVIPTLYGCREDTFFVTDEGAKRTHAQRRKILRPEDKHYTKWAAMCTLLRSLEGHDAEKATYQELEEAFARDLESAQWGLTTFGGTEIRGAIIAAFVYARPVDKAAIDEAAAKFITGADLAAKAPMLYLRESLRRSNEETDRKGTVGMRALPLARFVLRALQAHLEKTNVGVIRKESGESAHKWFAARRAKLGL